MAGARAIGGETQASVLQQRLRAALRIALSHYVASGLTVALGLLFISGGVHFWLGTIAASSAAVGPTCRARAAASSGRCCRHR
jgi:hypothetical protein